MQADTEGDGAMEAEEDNTFLYVCFFHVGSRGTECVHTMAVVL